ncbi:MAG: hypothetical protein KJ955_04620 [Nanoarchaeota archaeon]|nr:hypothetical protein [Nanoarchaeota archaeon]
MNYKSILFIVAALILLFAGSYTAISTVSNASNLTPKLEIELSKSSFAVNETLSGTITIPLSKAISPSSEISVKIQLPMKRTEKERLITDVLTNASINYTESTPIKKAENPETFKTLSFTDRQERSIAVKALLDSDINLIDMSMAASSTNALTNVKMDVGGDGSIEWHHLGARSGWSGYIKPEDFEETEGERKKIMDNLTRICQIIETPLSKDFQIFAKYNRLDTAGNITASIVVIDIDSIGDDVWPDEEVKNCDLPETDTFQWGSCNITNISDNAISGYVLACVYSTNGTSATGLYEIQAQAGATDTAYECWRGDTETDECTWLRAGNPFIKIKAGNYPKDLKGDIDFSEWGTGPDSMKSAMETIVQSPERGICDDLECVIELKFTANNTGSFRVSNLELEYRIGSGSPTSVNVFYDLTASGSVIEEINDIELPENDTIEIPLSVFNIKVPQLVLATANEGFVEVSFNGEKANDTFTVGGVISAPSSALGMLAETSDALDELSSATGDTQLILKILGLKADIAAAKIELADLETEITSDTQANRDRISEFRERLPKEIIFGSSIRDFQLIEPNDITTDVAPADRKEEVYLMQDKAQIKASVIAFSIKDFEDTITKYTLVKKEITARAALSKIDIYEVIAKTVADSRSDITFEEPPTPVEDDPVVKWFESSIAAGSKVEKNYVVKTDFDVAIDKVKTIIVPTEEVPEDIDTGDKAVCGDDICTLILETKETCPEDCASKFPWLTLFIIIIIAGLLFAYLAFYRGKYSLWHLTKKKKPFTSQNDLESVKDFIRTSREKKIEDSVIKSRLLEKGWKDEQIKFAFGEMEWEKKEKAAEKPTTNLNPMQDYIKTAIARKIPKEKILNNLVSKGWKEEDIKVELGIN